MSVSDQGAKRASAEELLRERAERVRAMIDRWAQEDVSGEPEWDVEDVAPLALRDGSGTPRSAGG